ncbi:helix-turn-helix domain-containing protein [Streptomyces sp. NPDC094143]|uniref:helix-turn-helix domain-containing protein n=1 Tax=unclassified Streptomyces TaxID=2593676 RepID=UPI00332B77E1
MKIRADIAALIRAGHTDTHIAAHTGYHRTTIARARRALHYPPATQLSRLYAEAIPTGRVKDWKPNTGPMPLSRDQQAANRQRLLAALRDTA